MSEQASQVKLHQAKQALACILRLLKYMTPTMSTGEPQSVLIKQQCVKPGITHLLERYLTRSILGTTTATQKVPVELVVIPSKNPGILLMRTSFCPACMQSGRSQATLLASDQCALYSVRACCRSSSYRRGKQVRLGTDALQVSTREQAQGTGSRKAPLRPSTRLCAQSGCWSPPLQ